MRQFDIFIGGEADAWMERNKNKVGDVANDPVLKAMEDAKIFPERVLEVGCANGWRLKEIKKRHRCGVTGVEPNQNIKVPFIYLGGAHDLRVVPPFDLVIYGFCLYLCDREQLFSIAKEGDRVLEDGGYLIVHDFSAPDAYRVPYHHKEGVFSYHFDYSKLWSWNPAYRVVARRLHEREDAVEEVVVLKKDLQWAWPLA